MTINYLAAMEEKVPDDIRHKEINEGDDEDVT